MNLRSKEGVKILSSNRLNLNKYISYYDQKDNWLLEVHYFGAKWNSESTECTSPATCPNSYTCAFLIIKVGRSNISVFLLYFMTSKILCETLYKMLKYLTSDRHLPTSLHHMSLTMFA